MSLSIDSSSNLEMAVLHIYNLFGMDPFLDRRKEGERASSDTCDDKVQRGTW